MKVYANVKRVVLIYQVSAGSYHRDVIDVIRWLDVAELILSVGYSGDVTLRPATFCPVDSSSGDTSSGGCRFCA